jgi:hypothetical protein
MDETPSVNQCMKTDTETKPIDVETVKEQALAVRQEEDFQVARGTPLDLSPKAFRAGLDRRQENRKSLIDWIRENLVEGVDFARIHVVGKAKCPQGNECKNPKHYSKPCLLKPGAEKICGMLGVTPTFPRLTDYEKACIDGVEIKQIILRCEIQNASGELVAFGVGARNLAQDYNDLNKALKMAEKSGHIDATLRMGGLSEVFNQDDDDSETGFGAPEFQKAEPVATEREEYLGKAETMSTTQTVKHIEKQATTEQRDKMLAQLMEKHSEKAILDYARKVSILLPTEGMGDWPICFVPSTKRQFDSLLASMEDFFEGRSSALRPPFNNTEAPIEKTKPKPKPAVSVPRDTHLDPSSETAAWRSFQVPFGNDKGTRLDKLDKKILYGWWAGFKCSTSYMSGTTEVQKSPAQLAKDKVFRGILDEAGRACDFKIKEAK